MSTPIHIFFGVHALSFVIRFRTASTFWVDKLLETNEGENSGSSSRGSTQEVCNAESTSHPILLNYRMGGRYHSDPICNRL